MPSDITKKTQTVALLGNPNTGKSTLFGALVGIHQHVGNYAGVTVEKKTGRLDHGGVRYELIDLPGVYSLAPRSRDEMVTVDVLLGRLADCPPTDAVVCILDASNLERNLYLVSQVLEFGLPTVVAVNMVDLAKRQGISLDLECLRERLNVPVVAIQANRKIGLDELKAALAEAMNGAVPKPKTPFPEPFENEVTRLQSYLSDPADPSTRLSKCLVRRLLLDMNGYLEKELLDGGDDGPRKELEAARLRLQQSDCGVPAVETAARFDWARRMLQGVVTEPEEYRTTATDRLDRVLTHRLWGTLVFAAVMIGVFQGVFLGAALVGWIDSATGAISDGIRAGMAEGALRSLLTDGLIAGVGGVLAFLPQILILFLFIAVLEDCGYMARAAFLMDKTMSRVGLSGKSFIPMLSSFACAIPGIMAARVIENERDRLTTILVAPLLTCSARLPVYALLIAAFIPARTYLGGLLSLQGLTLLGLYLLGIVTAVLVALILKRTLLRGSTPPFLLEMPSYKWPSPRTVVYRVVQRGRVFLRTAGTLILTVSIVVWAALYYPHDSEKVEAPFQARRQALQVELDGSPANDSEHQQAVEQMAELNRQIVGAYQRQSLLGQMGRVIEPVVEPLGWDWRIGCAVIASIPAREIVVATMGVIYNLGEDFDVESGEDASRLTARLHSATWDGSDPPRKVFNVPVALSVLVFYALCAQCVATLAVIRRETNSWRWPAFTFAYMTVLAYVGAFATYQVGMWMGG